MQPRSAPSCDSEEPHQWPTKSGTVPTPAAWRAATRKTWLPFQLISSPAHCAWKAGKGILAPTAKSERLSGGASSKGSSRAGPGRRSIRYWQATQGPKDQKVEWATPGREPHGGRDCRTRDCRAREPHATETQFAQNLEGGRGLTDRSTS